MHYRAAHALVAIGGGGGGSGGCGGGPGGGGGQKDDSCMATARRLHERRKMVPSVAIVGVRARCEELESRVKVAVARRLRRCMICANVDRRVRAAAAQRVADAPDKASGRVGWKPSQSRNSNPFRSLRIRSPGW